MPILGENSSIESNYIHGHILSLIIHTNRLKKLECLFAITAHLSRRSVIIPFVSRVD